MKAPRSEGGNFEKHPVGWTAGVCTRVIDLGTHWNDKKQKDEHKIAIAFESAKTMETGEFKGEPFLLYANFNFSMYQNAKLNEFIETWRAKKFHSQDEADAFDFSKLIGQPAYMNIIHSDDGKWVNIGTIGPMPEGMSAPQIKGKTILIDQEALDPAEIEKLTDKMKQKVLSAKERQGQDTEATQTPSQPYDELNPPPQTEVPQDFDDDIPF